MRTINLGIVAHVDAGKTSLTERLLYTAGVIDEIGSVDDGSTQTDSLALERQRGITIKAAVVSFVVGDVTVNLIDTPGHPDFIAEVERSLGVLDGAVLVVSAVEGVQAQTRVLMRALRRLRIPTLIFVNKIDRAGADVERVLGRIRTALTPAIVPMTSHDRDRAHEGLLDLLADHDDALLAAYVRGEPTDLPAALTAQTASCLVHPVYAGSAITGAGVDDLVAGITTLLPAHPGTAEHPLSGTVFKVERGPSGERIAYVRMFGGTVRVRDRLSIGGRAPERVTAISVFDNGTAVRRPAVSAGRIATLRGLSRVRIGDTVGAAPAASHVVFAPPTLETVVAPANGTSTVALHTALTQLAEQDPLINLRLDGHSIAVSLYGEVQKEVVEATLADEYGLAVEFRETTTIMTERPAGTGAAVELIGAAPNRFAATIGLRVDPAPANGFALEVELGSLPLAFFTAVEEAVTATLRTGPHGWRVEGCLVTMTHSGYWSPISTAGDFRGLAPIVLTDALARAGTTVHEPVHRFRIDLPPDTLAAVLPVLARIGALPTVDGAAICGEIPAASVHRLRRALPGLTRGEGVLECEFARYRPLAGAG